MLIALYRFLVLSYCTSILLIYAIISNKLVSITVFKYGHQTVKGIYHFWVYFWNVWQARFGSNTVAILGTTLDTILLVPIIPIHFITLFYGWIIYKIKAGYEKRTEPSGGDLEQ